MKYGFSTHMEYENDHTYWVAVSDSLKGCVGQGDTQEDAIKELEGNEAVWLKTAKEYDIEIPPLKAQKQQRYSGKISLRLSPSIHEHAAKEASYQNTSLNQFIRDAVVYYTAKCESEHSLDLPQVVQDKVKKQLRA